MTQKFILMRSQLHKLHSTSAEELSTPNSGSASFPPAPEAAAAAAEVTSRLTHHDSRITNESKSSRNSASNSSSLLSFSLLIHSHFSFHKKHGLCRALPFVPKKKSHHFKPQMSL
jgi:hypothetical protein